MPLVSIVINVWNGAATLREAIDSALAQTLTDWEIVVWDDASTDSGAEIVRSFQDPRIRYFAAAEHGSLGTSRNHALACAHGDWIAFLDQDDVWLPGKLEQQLALAETGVDLIFGRTITFDEKGRQWEYDHRHGDSLLPEGDIFEALFRDSCFIAMSSAMIRRTALERVGPIPDRYQVICDYFLFTAVARHGKARAVQDVICRYRVHSGNMSPANRVRMHEEALKLLDDWAGDLDPELLDHRRRVHATVLAVGLMAQPGLSGSGFAYLWREGSLTYLCSRAVALSYRTIRRHLAPRGRLAG